MSRRSCRELGLCQVETALTLDRPCPQPCAECTLHVTPVIVEGKTVALEVGMQREPAYALSFPFAPGTIEGHQREASPAREVARLVASLTAAICLVVGLVAITGLVAGYLYGKGRL